MIVGYRDAEPNGLAEMVGGLLEANIAADPTRRRLLAPARVHLAGTDAEVDVHLDITREGIVVGNGAPPRRPHLAVSTDAAGLLDLAAAPLRLGLPDVADPRGRAVLARLLRRDLRIRGLLRHPIRLTRLARLLSVA